MSGELTALFSSLLRSPDEHSLRGAWRGLGSLESPPGPEPSCRRCPFSATGRPGSLQPVRTPASGASARVCPAAQGALRDTAGGRRCPRAWPACPPGQTWAALPKRRTRTRRWQRPEGPRPGQPGHRSSAVGGGCGPSSCPDCPNRFYFLTLSVLNRPKSKSILTQTRPRVPVSGVDGRAPERSMLVALAGRRGRPRPRPPPHEHCGAP